MIWKWIEFVRCCFLLHNNSQQQWKLCKTFDMFEMTLSDIWFIWYGNKFCKLVSIVDIAAVSSFFFVSDTRRSLWLGTFFSSPICEIEWKRNREKNMQKFHSFSGCFTCDMWKWKCKFILLSDQHPWWCVVRWKIFLEYLRKKSTMNARDD